MQIAVADAFHENLVLHPSLLKFVELTYGCKATDLSLYDHRLRLAKVPASSRLIYGRDQETSLPSEYPVVSVRNVFILPGLPQFFQLGFAFIKVRYPDPCYLHPDLSVEISFLVLTKSGVLIVSF